MTDAALTIVRTPDDYSAALASARAEGKRVALTPTMGALHEGHLSLVRLGAAHADVATASLFVNPTQFAPGEDFETYPRDEARDAALLAEAGCTLLYAPSADVMYPDGFATTVVVEGPAEGLEAHARPQFFRGVATVVSKLLAQTRPDVAVFGEKDYQQLLVIRRLVLDLDLGVEIVAGPTMREPDGLAMSSRNAYLNDTARTIAGRLNVRLAELANELSDGAPWREVEARGVQTIGDSGFEAVDYVAVRDADTLAAPASPRIETAVRVLAAARVAGVRLIDNLPAAPKR